MALKGEEDAPKIRIARPFTVMPFEGTRKRRRAAMGEYTWSVGDRVDAWMDDRYVCIAILILLCALLEQRQLMLPLLYPGHHLVA